MGRYVHCGALVDLCHPAGPVGLDALWNGTGRLGLTGMDQQGILVHCAEGSETAAAVGTGRTDAFYRDAGNRHDADFSPDRIGSHCGNAGFYGGIRVLAAA